MPQTAPARDFLLPRVSALLAEAVAHGIARDVAVAVLIDIVTSPGFDTALPDPRDDDPTAPVWDHRAEGPVLVGGTSPRGPLPIGAQDEADFVKPQGWFQSTI
jgi:hypothetical protein